MIRKLSSRECDCDLLKSALVGDGDLVAHSVQHTDHYQLGFDRAVVDDIGAMKCRP